MICCALPSGYEHFIRDKGKRAADGVVRMS
jgi:hypothetical protein